MFVGRIDYWTWFVRLMTWDGVLPLVLGLVPLAVGVAIPNCRGAMETTAVALPVAAFLMRSWAGLWFIRTNNCCAKTREFQGVAFAIALFLLLFFDAISILAHVMPSGAVFATWLGFFVFMALFQAMYLGLMAIALYPGRVWRLDFCRAWRV
jgi:hypothetical protein